MKPKYKLSFTELTKPGNIEKLKHDGFTNEAIHREMYSQTDGASQRQREEIMSKLHERGK